MGGFNKKTIEDVKLAGKRVLLRADYNVPLKEGKIVDDFRIRQSLPTIKYILDQKPASLTIISHLGRPEGKRDADFSLLPVAGRLSQLLDRKVAFGLDCVGKQAQMAAGSGSHISLLENLRYHPEEEQNNTIFAHAIVDATGADIFVQDGFGVVHRAHASTEAITKLLPSVAGLLLAHEAQTLLSVIENPRRPLVAVVGGAKVSDKIEVLQKFIETADCVAIGGALANNFLVAEGHKLGKSLIEKTEIKTARELLATARAEEKKRNFTFMVPVDAVVSHSSDGRLTTRIVDLGSQALADIEAYPKQPEHKAINVAADEQALDIGPISAARIAGAVDLCNTVIWGGTLGVTETKGIAGAPAPFAHATEMVVEAMIGRSNAHLSKPFSVVGGGDTVAYVQGQRLVDDFNHVSTGGSASLELLAGKKLPGIESLLDK